MNIVLQIESIVGRTLCIYLVCEQAPRGAVWRKGGNKKESLQLRLWNLNVCIEKVYAKCS